MILLPHLKLGTHLLRGIIFSKAIKDKIRIMYAEKDGMQTKYREILLVHGTTVIKDMGQKDR